MFCYQLDACTSHTLKEKFLRCKTQIKPSVVFTILSSLCGHPVRLFVNKIRTKAVSNQLSIFELIFMQSELTALDSVIMNLKQE